MNMFLNFFLLLLLIVYLYGSKSDPILSSEKHLQEQTKQPQQVHISLGGNLN